MKKVSVYLCLFLSLAIFSVCISCVGDNTSSGEKSVDSITLPSNIESAIKHTTIWKYDAVGDSMVKHTIDQNISVQLVLDTLNNRYGNSKLQIEKSVGDTLYVKIDDVSYLTQYGSTGNYMFLSEIVYCLTELPGINYVFLNFEEVDHAMPGLYRREDFDNKIVE